MWNSRDGTRTALFRHRRIGLTSFWGVQLWFTLVPGAICSSPPLFLWLGKSAPLFDYFWYVMALPGVLSAVFFMPAVILIRVVSQYDTMKQGWLFPLPADSLASWALVLTVHAAIIAAIWGTGRVAAAALRRDRSKERGDISGHEK